MQTNETPTKPQDQPSAETKNEGQDATTGAAHGVTAHRAPNGGGTSTNHGTSSAG